MPHRMSSRSVGSYWESEDWILRATSAGSSRAVADAEPINTQPVTVSRQSETCMRSRFVGSGSDRQMRPSANRPAAWISPEPSGSEMRTLDHNRRGGCAASILAAR